MTLSLEWSPGRLLARSAVAAASSNDCGRPPETLPFGLDAVVLAEAPWTLARDDKQERRQTAASRRMEQSASTLADGRFAACMDETEQSPGARRARVAAAAFGHA